MKIAITGTPGTGKTAVAKGLAKKLGWELLELNELAEKTRCFCGYDRKRETRIVDVEKLKKEVQKIAKKNLILESHYAHEIPNDMTIILRCDIEELRKRMLKKGFPPQKIEENLQAEIFGVCKGEALDLRRNILEIDTTGKASREVVKEIKRKIPI